MWLRKAILIVVLVVAWELYARRLDNPLLVPTFTETITTWWDGIAWGVLRTGGGIAAGAGDRFQSGVALAFILTVPAITTRIGTDFLETMTAMFNPLPAIALLPLALIWFGLGLGSLVFVLVHSVCGRWR